MPLGLIQPKGAASHPSAILQILMYPFLVLTFTNKTQSTLQISQEKETGSMQAE